MSGLQIIAEVRSQDGWDGLLEAFRLAFDKLGTSYRALNDIAGIAEGHAEKLLAPIPIKEFGRKSFGPILGALGIKILVVIDEPALASVRQHSRYSARRVDAPSRHSSVNVRIAKAKRRRAKLLPPGKARMMRARQILMTPASKRSEIARTAARARWRKPRVIEVKGKQAQELRCKLGEDCSG